MVTEKRRIKLTYEDYRNTPDDKRYELLDGELILAPAPRTTHQTVQNNISWRMSQFVAMEGLGKVFNAPTDVVLMGTDIVQPDIVFVSREREHIVMENDIQGAPDLVVEVLSPSTASRDRGYKRSLYARHGVREYWMAGVESATITVLVLGESGFEVFGTFGEGERFRSPTLGGFEVEIDVVFGLPTE